MYVNSILISFTSVHNHLRIINNDKLNYKYYLNIVLNKVKRVIILLHKFPQGLLRQSLITIKESFIRPYLDYGEIMYDYAFNELFYKKR